MNKLKNEGASTRAAALRVCAVVVTFNRCELLRECLAALQQQTRKVDEILVVDNASSDGTLEMLQRDFSDVRVLALEKNTGGAGGFHEGAKRAFEDGFDWLWLMDDDGKPAPDCLETLLSKSQPNAVIIPVQRGHGGRSHGVLGWRHGKYIDIDMAAAKASRRIDYQLLFTFVGPLISRSIIEKVGLPNPDFFIWFDDFEYAFRIKKQMRKAKFIVVPEAKFFHEPGISWREVKLLGLGKTKSRRTFATWRAYYMARNSFYTLLRTHRNPRQTTLFLLQQLRVLAAVLMYDHDRWRRAGMQLLGLWDGALGRLGKRI